MQEFKLTQDYIELNKLLKLLQWAVTGGHAKILVQNGEVIRNGEIEDRVRAKLVVGDIIECEGNSVKIV